MIITVLLLALLTHFVYLLQHHFAVSSQHYASNLCLVSVGLPFLQMVQQEMPPLPNQVEE